MRSEIALQKYKVTRPKSSLTKILKTLSAPRRLEILAYLKRNNSAHVHELAERFSVSIDSVSRHLRILRYTYLVQYKYEGKYIRYHLQHPLPKIVKLAITEHLRNCTSVQKKYINKDKNESE